MWGVCMVEEISLRELIETLWAGKGIIITLTIIALTISGVVSYLLIEPTYEAKAVLQIKETKTSQSREDISRLEALIDNYSATSQDSVQDYISKAKSEQVLTKAVARLQIDIHEMPLNKLANKIKVTNIKDTNLFEVTVKDSSPQKATEIANALAEEFSDYLFAENKNNSQKMILLLEKQREAAQADFASCVEEMNEFLKQPDNAVKREQLQLKLDMAKENYIFFQKKHAELLAVEEMGLDGFGVTIVSSAHVPSTPIAPKKALNLAVAACLGLMLGVFVVLFKAYWENSAVDRKQVI